MSVKCLSTQILGGILATHPGYPCSLFFGATQLAHKYFRIHFAYIYTSFFFSVLYCLSFFAIKMLNRIVVITTICIRAGQRKIERQKERFSGNQKAQGSRAELSKVCLAFANLFKQTKGVGKPRKLHRKNTNYVI